MPRLEDQELLAGKPIDPSLDLVDAAEHILERAGVVDGGANQPDLGQRQADEEDGLARRRDGGDAAQERGQCRRGDGHTAIQRGHAEGDQGVEDPVLLQEKVDLGLG